MGWTTRIANSFRHAVLSRELDDELAFHIAELTDELEERGMSRRDAARAARARFGNYTLQKERTWDMNLVGVLENLGADMRFAWRQLRLNRGFTAVALLSLTLGIGANTTIFQLINALRLRPLPVAHPEQLVEVDFPPRDFFVMGAYSSRHAALTSAQVEQVAKEASAFSEIIAFHPDRFNLSKNGRVRYAEGLHVSPNFLHALGIRPALGHDLERESPGSCSAETVVSNSFWQREFGGDPLVIGKPVTLDGYQFKVAGVTPPDFTGLEPGSRWDLAIPLCANALLSPDGKGYASDPMAWWLTVIGRMKPGWDVQRASDDMRRISPRVFSETVPPKYRANAVTRYKKNRLKAVSARAGVSGLRSTYEDSLFLLMGITALVLLIACANLANLLLARGTAREREIAVRQALGASRARLIGQLLTESLLLSSAGTILAFALAQMLSRWLVGLLETGRNPIALELQPDWRLLLFIASLACSTCLLFGLLPALRTSATNPATDLRGGRTATAGRERNRLRRVLVASQVALSLVLLVGALLFARSINRLLRTPTGFQADQVLNATVIMPPSLASDERRCAATFRQLLGELQQSPIIESVGASRIAPFSGNRWNDHALAPGTSRNAMSWLNAVSPGYFEALKTRIVAGRDLTPHDDAAAPKVAIVNQAFASVLFGGKNAVGQVYELEAPAGKQNERYQVVGVVSTTAYDDLRARDQLIAYTPVAQLSESDPVRNFVIRGRGSLDAVARDVQHRLAAVDGSALVEFHVLQAQIRDSTLRDRMMAYLTCGFGVLAACLSTIGIYGVMSYLVARRRGEIGIRLALGATRTQVISLVLRDAAVMVGVGLVIGLCFSLWTGRFAEALLFELRGNDPGTLVAACLLLLITAACATLVPARRAANLQPQSALREE